jgi:superfamily I DNA/RNA helicase
MTTLVHIGDELAVHIMSFIVEPKKKLTDDWEKNEELKEIIQKPYSDFWNNIFCYSDDISFIEDMKKRNYNVYNVYRNKEAGKIIKDTLENIKKKREMLDNDPKMEMFEEQQILKKKLYDRRSFYMTLSMNESKEAAEIIKEEMKRYIDKNDKEGLQEFLSEIYLYYLLLHTYEPCF